MNEPIKAELKKAYLFHEFTEEEFNKIIPISKHEIFNAGDQLFSQGVHPEAFYIVHYGSIRLYAAGPQSELEYSMFVGNGGVIGESGIISELPRVLNAEILERTELLRVTFKELNAMFKTHPEAALKFYHALSRHLASMMHYVISELVQIREAHHIEKHGLSSI